MAGWITLLAVFLSSTVCCANSDMISTVSNITRLSSAWVRPVKDWSSPLSLYLDLHVLKILDVNEKEETVKLHIRLSQRWRDEFVSWDPSWYGGLPNFTVPTSRLWTPDITIKEAIAIHRQYSEGYVCVEWTGWVNRVEDIVLTLHCDLAMLLFPFDQQKCNITLYPQLHTEQDVILYVDTRGRSEFDRKGHGEWDLMEVKVYTYSLKQYSQLSFQVELGRYSLFYVLNLMVPSLMVMLIDVAAFAVPVNCAERIPFKVTLLFGYTVFLVLITDILPPFRDTTPVLGVYLVVCLILLCVSMGESVLLLTLGQPDSHTHSTPLEKIIQRVSPQLLKTDGPSEHLRAYRRHVNRGLKRSFALRHGREGPGLCGRGCVIDRLKEELEDVSEELRKLNRVNAQRSSRLHLMEALDRFCFKLYISTLAVFALSLTLLWTLNR
ncbi:5-hydroxytryptamine receptor 3A-like [Colossoma macropomum]|uniref:5-hydroxytryptamine receptor 3A-like n=1 Tax=Colossoma macropomum TaxID=42526 RepID=UPI0018652D0B|nr:5-hydroxytryptamine receptor 3A-like [Colossoma macropomum]